MTGGYAEKHGYSYEAWWAALQALKLIQGDCASIQVDNFIREDGIDLTVVSNDQCEEGSQCKTRNQSGKGNWTLPELGKKKCIRYLRDFLQADKKRKYFFVSNNEPTDIKNLAILSRKIESLSEFEAFIASDESKKTLWEKWTDLLEIGADKSVSFDLLSRSIFSTFDDDISGRDHVISFARSIFENDPLVSIGAIAKYLEENIGRPIYRDSLIRELNSRGLRLKKIVLGTDVHNGITKLIEKYVASIEPHLIDNQVIPRPEIESILKSLKVPYGRRLHCVHGRAGFGKSVVLHALCKHLVLENIPFLPVRLDVDIPNRNSIQFGSDCGLPTSLVRSLTAIASDRSCVLILDQLDALRWTPQHNSSAWSVFQEIVREALASNSRLHVVVACRTSDLRNDMNISPWRNSPAITNELEEHELKELDEPVIEKIVTQHQGDWGKLTPRQRSLLRQPQLLAIWLNLQLTNSARSSFRSASDLMSRFFLEKMSKLDELGLRADARMCLDELIGWLDRQARISAPASICHKWPKALDALRSCGILDHATDPIKFAHQSFLDYSIARRISDNLQNGNQLKDWLRATDQQSLLRRGQLRYLLSLLRDEQPDVFISWMRELIIDESIRFHLRQLCLQFLGELDEPTDHEFGFILELIATVFWRDIVLSQVVCGHAPWVKLLARRGKLLEWYISHNANEVDMVYRIFVSISEIDGDEVAHFIDNCQFQNAEERLSLIKRFMPWNARQDSDRMFELRLELMDAGKHEHLESYLSLVAEKGTLSRVVEVLDRELKRIPARDNYQYDFQDKNADWPWWLPHHVAEKIKEAILEKGSAFWEKLHHHLMSAAARPKEFPYPDDFPFLQDPIWHDSHSSHRYRGNSSLATLLATAASHAINSGEMSLDDFQVFSSGQARIVQQVLLTAMHDLADQHADQVIGWLTSDWRRMALGKIETNTNWSLSQTCIKKFALVCSDKQYRMLESTIGLLRPQWEIEDAKDDLRARKQGPHDYQYRANRIGLLRYAMLEALPGSRISSGSREQLQQLRAKYTYASSEYDDDRGLRGGFVKSPITNKTGKLSNNAWLELIAKGNIQRRRSIRHDYDLTEESSVYTFSQSLRVQAELEPVRFGRLSLSFPDHADHSYWAGVLNALSKTESPEKASSGSWAAADAELCHAVVKKLGYVTKTELAIPLLWMVHYRQDFIWEPWVHVLIRRYAKEHADPESDAEDNFGHENRLDYLTWNSVRGICARIIAGLLFKNAAFLEEYKDSIVSFSKESVVGMRSAAIHALLPVLNNDQQRDWAVDLFLTTCASSDDELLESRSVHDFFYYSLSQHGNRYDEIFQRMLKSDMPKIKEEGIVWISLVWLYEGRFDSEFRQCYTGGILERKTVADVLSSQLVHEQVTLKCQALLPDLMNDPEKEVWKACAAFNYSSSFDFKTLNDFLLKYVASKAYLAEHYHFVNQLLQSQQSLAPYSTLIFAMCDRDVNVTEEELRENEARYSIGETIPLLLRLYSDVEEDTDGPIIRKACLDRWDEQLRKKPFAFHRVLAAIDS